MIKYMQLFLLDVLLIFWLVQEFYHLFYLYELNLLKNAMESFSKAVELEPDNVEFLIEFADVLFLNQELEKAITVLKRALRITPDSREIYSKLVLFYEENNNPKEGIKILNKYLKKHSDEDFKIKLKELSLKK